MEFKFIEEIFDNLEINLVVCKAQSSRYKTVIYQHEGILEATSQRIGNQENVDHKFDVLLNYVIESKPDLFITPEYSTPWTKIEEIVQNANEWVNQDALWVLGCESITKNEIVTLKEKYNNNNSIIYFDEMVLVKNENFLDPILYVFKGKQNNIDKIFFLIQFKNYHMGVRAGGDVERNNMIAGNELYIIRNTNVEINLLTLICSEAMNFQTQTNQAFIKKFNFNYNPFLIINVQCNPHPENIHFINFRNHIFTHQAKEIIVVNWHLYSKYSDGSKIFQTSSSRSGIYIYSTDINLNNEIRVKNNYNLGLFLFHFSNIHRYYYLFKSNVHIFEYSNLPVSIQALLPPQTMRDGVEINTSAIIYKNTLLKFKNGLRGSTNKLFSRHTLQSNYFSKIKISHINKERLLNLSIGNIDIGKNNLWHENINLLSTKMKTDDEKNKSITVFENVNPIQSEFVGRINKILRILKNPIDLPENFKDLTELNLTIGFCKDSRTHNYLYNICIDDNSFTYSLSACIIFLDSTISRMDAWKFLDSISPLYDGANRSRILVCFEYGGVIEKINNPVSSINNSTTYKSSSILK